MFTKVSTELYMLDKDHTEVLKVIGMARRLYSNRDIDVEENVYNDMLNRMIACRVSDMFVKWDAELLDKLTCVVIDVPVGGRVISTTAGLLKHADGTKLIYGVIYK